MLGPRNADMRLGTSAYSISRPSELAVVGVLASVRPLAVEFDASVPSSVDVEFDALAVPVAVELDAPAAAPPLAMLAVALGLRRVLVRCGGGSAQRANEVLERLHRGRSLVVLAVKAFHDLVRHLTLGGGRTALHARVTLYAAVNVLLQELFRTC